MLKYASNMLAMCNANNVVNHVSNIKNHGTKMVLKVLKHASNMLNLAITIVF